MQIWLILTFNAIYHFCNFLNASLIFYFIESMIMVHGYIFFFQGVKESHKEGVHVLFSCMVWFFLCSNLPFNATNYFNTLRGNCNMQHCLFSYNFLKTVFKGRLSQSFVIYYMTYTSQYLNLSHFVVKEIQVRKITVYLVIIS